MCLKTEDNISDYRSMNGNKSQSQPMMPSSSSSPSPSSTPLSTTQKIIYTFLWMIITYLSKEFAKFLAIHQSNASKLTFVPAYYVYDKDTTYFDNTFLTYGTDCFICLIMMYASYMCYSTCTSVNTSNASTGTGTGTSTSASASATTNKLGYFGSALFGSYAISVLSGAYAHYVFRDVDSMNTINFRIWWILCVGTVTAAGGFMGMIGSEIGSFFYANDEKNKNNSRNMNINMNINMNNGQSRFHLMKVHIALWCIYGLFMTFVCIIGEISYTRPACDIFVAGTTQFPPTMYCILILLSIKWKDAIPLLEESTDASHDHSYNHNHNHSNTYIYIKRKTRIIFYVGFILNAQLLPSYPLLVQYTNLSLGAVNALLHLNLTVAWSMQAWSVYSICLVMNNHNHNHNQSNNSVSSNNNNGTSEETRDIIGEEHGKGENEVQALKDENQLMIEKKTS